MWRLFYDTTGVLMRREKKINGAHIWTKIEFLLQKFFLHVQMQTSVLSAGSYHPVSQLVNGKAKNKWHRDYTVSVLSQKLSLCFSALSS